MGFKIEEMVMSMNDAQMKSECKKEFKTFQCYFMNSHFTEIHTREFIVLNYFILTTLSTLGLGDYHAISSFERIWLVIIMLFGVSLFSVSIEFL